MVERQVATTQTMLEVACDGPVCKKTIDVKPSPADEVPPGWIFTMMGEGVRKHYCSNDCLADAVVP